MKTLGDKIARIAQPVARSIDYAFGTNVANCSGCHKMQSNLNAGMSLSDAIYERWFKAKQQGITTMQYQMQIVVEADSLKEAVQKVQGGEIISAQVKPPTPVRPVPQPVQRPPQPQPTS